MFAASDTWLVIYVFVFVGTGSLLSQLDLFHVAGIALFIGASLMQHQSMVLLARLRTGKSGKCFCVF